MRIKIAVALIFGIALTGYNIGSPWNCEQARSMYADADKERDDVVKRFANGGFPSLSHAETAAMDATDKAADRFQKVKEMCKLESDR